MIRAPVLLLAAGVGFAAVSPAGAQQPAQIAPGSTPADALRVLIEQARFWQAQFQPDRAVDALNRVLVLDAGNADALAMLAGLQAERGDRAGGQATLARLRERSPADPRIAGIDGALRMGAVDQGALAEARRLAQEDRGADAVQRYQRIFKGDTPPAALSTEYYQTLAGTAGGWERARDGLARLVVSAPGDLRAQLAYAELLTYREPSRADGIGRLRALAASPAIADSARQALRRALLWLPDAPASVPQLEAELARNPGDAELARKLDAARNPRVDPADATGRDRVSGFAALDRNRLADAERGFQQAMARDADDAEATGGLGVVRLRQGRLAEARTLLARAIQLDPSKRAQWQAALAGASTGGAASREYAEVISLADRGEYDRAEALLRRLMGGQGNAGNYLQLGDIQGRAGRLAEAEASFRASLGGQPGNTAALVGLAGVLAKQGRDGEADELFARAESTGRDRGAIGRVRAEQLRLRAAQAADPVAQTGLYRAAVVSDPGNPWLRLELARALLRQNRGSEARSVMSDVAEGVRPDPQAVQAALIFAQESGDLDSASRLIARLPPGARTPEMQEVQARVALQGELRQATAVPGRAARVRLLALAARPDPTGFRGAEIARALFAAGDRPGGREAIATALAATRRPTPEQQLAYSGALLAAGLTEDAAALAEAIDTARLPPGQARSAERLRNGIAVREADALNEQGRVADAYDQLAPQLAENPADPDLNMALGRLYQAARNPREALAINEAVLRGDAGNVEVRRSAVAAAIAAGELARADALVHDGLQLLPQEPRLYVMSADVARARGNNGRALRELRTARDLRRQQLGNADAPLAPEPRRPFARPGDDPNAGVSYQLSRTPPAQAEAAYANPFRRDPAPGGDPAQPGIARNPALVRQRPVDPLTGDIDRRMAELNQEVAPKAQVGVSLRGRSGDEGLDQLTQAMVPVEAVFSPGGVGTLKLQAQPTFLSGGMLGADPASLQRFGTNPLFALSPDTPRPGDQTASGVGLGLSYSLGWATADIGSTPLGFRQQNLVGGVELAPSIGRDLRLRAVGERRAVTDSVLAYAGAEDPASGLTWGGVTRTRGHLQLEWTPGLLNLYAGAGGATLRGENVASNTQYEFGAGGSYPVYRTATQEVRAGLDLVYFGYDRNLRLFTLGHGGYFSPQSYFAALIPVSYKEQVDEKFSYSVGGSVGFQTYNERRSPVFPNDPARQARLEGLVANTPLLNAFYPARSESGIVGGAFANAEYKLSDSLRLGGRAQFQRAGNFTEGTGLVYARYTFNQAP